ncbi:MAG: hypothetical protein WB711_11450 [Terriglobales bacterium]
MIFASMGVAKAQQSTVPLEQQHVGRVVDWSYRHVIFSGGLPAGDWDAVKAEPRILFHLAERNPDNSILPNPGLHNPRLTIPPRDWHPPLSSVNRRVDEIRNQKGRNVRVDWSVALGTGNLAANTFPAKYGFNINGTPSCTNDYVVYGLNVAGVTNGQPNLVGINNLYSGTGGFCGANPAVYWAYNGSTAAGSVLTSTSISMDGTKIAYVESGATSAVFHVLTWKSGDGTIAKAKAPTVPPSCTATTSCLKSVTLSATATTTYSSAWVDYATDKVFVATDDGKIYRLSCAFTCALNSNPTIDWTYTLPVAGTGGTLPQPNGPVYNYPYGLLFIGDQLGEMWVIKANGSTASLFAGPLMVGGGGCGTTNPPGRTGTGFAVCTPASPGYGIPDSVILDASGGSEKIYAFSGNDGTSGGAAVVAQMNQDLTGLVRTHIGLGGVSMHSGAFDNEYWGNTPSTGELFVCGTGAANTEPTHYWIGFTSYPVMNSTPTGSLLRLATANLPCVPYTEFYNPNINLGGVSGDHDLLISGLAGASPNGYIITDDISSGAITAGLNDVAYPGGVSGIIVDNDSADAQASSVYFSTLGSVNVGTCANAHCAVKLTQLALQ